MSTPVHPRHTEKEQPPPRLSRSSSSFCRDNTRSTLAVVREESSIRERDLCYLAADGAPNKDEDGSHSRRLPRRSKASAKPSEDQNANKLPTPSLLKHKESLIKKPPGDSHHTFQTVLFFFFFSFFPWRRF